MTLYEVGLERGPANSMALTPLSFLDRSGAVYARKAAVIHGDRTFTYAEFSARCRRLASALARRGIGVGDTVTVMAPNVPAMLEAHYGVPMVGAVLNALNVRLDARSMAFILDHGESKFLIADTEFRDTVEKAQRPTAASPHRAPGRGGTRGTMAAGKVASQIRRSPGPGGDWIN